MIAYRYDSLGFYVGEVDCQLNPLETKAQGKEVYILPANATYDKPTLKEGYTPRWNGKTWEQYADDKKVYGYTDNADGTINYYGVEHTEEELTAKNKGVDLSFADSEPVSVDGVYWLSADNPDYIEAKKAHDKQEKLTALVAQYEADKAELLKYYADAMIHGDSDLMAELKEEMTELDEQYATDYKALKEGE
jgi:hypothetical protein